MPLARPRLTPLTLAAGLLLLAAPVLAAATAPATAPASKPSSLYTALFLPSAPVHGLMAFLDPETGQIGSASLPLTLTEDMRPQLPMEALFEVALPGGGFMVDLQGTGEHFSTLTTDVTGMHRHFGCADHAHAAPRSITMPAKPVHVLLPYAER